MFFEKREEANFVLSCSATIELWLCHSLVGQVFMAAVCEEE